MSTSGKHRFLVIEGIDGAGKTTTARLIAEHVRRTGRPLNRVGQHSWLDPQAARVIIDVREDRPHRHTHEQIIEAYFRDKQLQSQAIEELLADRTVLADRYIFSDVVYLEALYGVPARQTLDRHYRAGIRFPDLLVYLDVPTGTATDRVVARGKSMRHYENKYTLEKVARVYRSLLLENRPPYLPPVQVFANASGAHLDERMTELLKAIDLVWTHDDSSLEQR